MPSRIISLVPSQTELLADLGLDQEVVGITKFCIHPTHWKQNKTIIGGTKNLRMQVIQGLSPDLILANKEENVKEQVEELAQKYRVWTSDISTLEDAHQMILGIGRLTNKEERATEISNEIREVFLQIQKPASGLRVIYLIWKNPYMTAGGDTFIHEMLQAAGFENLCAGMNRYPEMSPELIRDLQPDVILLSSEPFPFKEKHREEMASLFPASRVVLADGEMFSWYGSRLLKAPAYFASLKKDILSTNPALDAI